MAHVPVIMQRQVPSNMTVGVPQFQLIDRVVASLWTETGMSRSPQVQLLDKLSADCGFWQIDKAVDVPVICRPGSCSISSLTPGFHLDAPTQSFSCQARHLTTMMKVWVMTTILWSTELRMRRRRWRRSLMGDFAVKCGIFRAPSAWTLSAIFRSPRALTAVSARAAQ